MKLSVKLSLMAGFLMVLTVALGLFSLVQMSKINDGSTDINQNWLPSTRLGWRRYSLPTVLKRRTGRTTRPAWTLI